MRERQTTPLAAIVLAAGASRRFGSRPKALLPVGGENALERVIRTSRLVGCDPIVVVLGAHHEEIRSAMRGSAEPPDAWVENVAWEQGRTGSAQAGLRAVPGESSTLLWPVDAPLARPGTVREIVRRSESDALGLWFLPEYQGEGGHPVLWKPGVRTPVYSLAADAPLRSLLPRLALSVVRVPVDDPGVTTTFHTPEEYHRAMANSAEGE